MGILCGVDIIEIERIKYSIDNLGQDFKDRIFTDKEINYCEDKKRSKYQSYAARFAAKEAVSKAFGTGIGSEISWKDIEISNDELGRPHITLMGKAKEFFKQLEAQEISISLSHCEAYAIAYVIIETR